MLHLVSPWDLCRWDAGGRWIALNARHWITGPTTWGKCLGRGNGSAERLAQTGSTLERAMGCKVSLPTSNICTYFLCNVVFHLVGCLLKMELGPFASWMQLDCIAASLFAASNFIPASNILLLAVPFMFFSYKTINIDNTSALLVSITILNSSQS